MFPNFSRFFVFPGPLSAIKEDVVLVFARRSSLYFTVHHKEYFLKSAKQIDNQYLSISYTSIQRQLLSFNRYYVLHSIKNLLIFVLSKQNITK